MYTKRPYLGPVNLQIHIRSPGHQPSPHPCEQAWNKDNVHRFGVTYSSLVYQFADNISSSWRDIPDIKRINFYESKILKKVCYIVEKIYIITNWGFSSVVERVTIYREVSGSIPEISIYNFFSVFVLCCIVLFSLHNFM